MKKFTNILLIIIDVVLTVATVFTSVMIFMLYNDFIDLYNMQNQGITDMVNAELSERHESTADTVTLIVNIGTYSDLKNGSDKEQVKNALLYGGMICISNDSKVLKTLMPEAANYAAFDINEEYYVTGAIANYISNAYGWKIVSFDWPYMVFEKTVIRSEPVSNLD